MNSSRARLSVLTHQWNKEAEAKAAGIDVTDRAAFRAFERAKIEALWSSISNRQEGFITEAPADPRHS